MFLTLFPSSAVHVALVATILSALAASAVPKLSDGYSDMTEINNSDQIPVLINDPQGPLANPPTDLLSTTAAPGLSVAVSGPGTVTDVENLLLKVTVTNTGQEALKLINDPRGPLTPSPTKLFLITGPNSASPNFIGISAKYAGVDVVATYKHKDAFTVLDPGKSVEVTHDLSKAYDFTGPGSGQYTFEAINLFFYVDESQNAIPLRATVKPHSLLLKGKLFAGLGLHQLATFEGCSATQQTQINTAITGARTYVSNAISYITAHTTTSPRFTTWFGTFQSTRRNVVLSNFNSLTTTGTEFTGWKYDCTLVNCDPGVFAFVNPTVYGVVHLCDRFWPAPQTGTDSKAGTLVHEGTHFVGTAGTKDYAYGQGPCQALAISNPNQAVNNADSHEYFAENTPPLQ